jgi:hypothetical protein
MVTNVSEKHAASTFSPEDREVRYDDISYKTAFITFTPVRT